MYLIDHCSLSRINSLYIPLARKIDAHRVQTAEDRTAVGRFVIRVFWPVPAGLDCASNASLYGRMIAAYVLPLSAMKSNR